MLPASEDESVQALLDSEWRVAIAAAREAMEHLRVLVPELRAHLPETAYMHLHAALEDSEHAYGRLHQAGPFVLGQDDYDSFLAAQTARRIGS